MSTNSLEHVATTQIYIDEIQSHMVGVILIIMNNYGLTTNHIDYYNQISLASQVNLDCQSNQLEQTNLNEIKNSTQDEIVLDCIETQLESKPQNNKMYVAHRRAFRDAISNDNKICPQYKNCTDDNCKRFHVLEKNLCPHAGRNNYCDQINCDKIVIKACRKGKKCSDNSCSFRH